MKHALFSAGSDVDSSTIDSVCVYLLKLFRSVEKIQVAHLNELKLRFPTFSQSLVTKTFDLIRSLVSTLPENFSFDRSSSCTKVFFGKGNPFNKVEIPNNVEKPWSNRLVVDAALQEEEKIVQQQEILPQPAAAPSTSTTTYSRKWLQDRLRVVIASRSDSNSLNLQEMCNLLFESLVSKQTDDELQQTLCDMIGFDHIELICELIQNRRSIIDGVVQTAKNRPREIVRNEDLSQRNAQPVHGPGFVIQSKQEKQIEKQIRKEDRRARQGNTGRDELDDLMDPELIRYERDRQLLLAASERQEKLSINPSGQSNNRNIRYPFVFDQLIEIKQKTAYIGGRNLLLPENTERRTSNTFDLVHIPPSEPIRIENLGKKICPGLVRFEDLETLGQILFKDSIKTLNLVQSVVYKTAAFSNENILISAP